MVRIALAQIFYKPAIVERDVNHLSEPGLVQDDVCTTSLLEKLSLDALDKRNDLKELQENIHGGYITYISQKLREVCKQICKIYQPDLLVFPEYSVPNYESLGEPTDSFYSCFDIFDSDQEMDEE